MKSLISRTRATLTALALVILICGQPGGTYAAMALEQMKLFQGAAQLGLTADQLFRNCGLPAEIVDRGPEGGGKQDIHWNGTAMRLSAMDWDVVYGMEQAKPGKRAGWTNGGKRDNRCLKDLSQLALTARGNVGILTVTKKAQGFGYKTSYQVPKSLFKSHKIVGVTATLVRSVAVSTLVGRYGRPDEVLKQSGNSEKFRYWVLSLRDQRPELLYAVDFEIDGGNCKTYAISSSDVGFVQRRLDSLLKQWERDYVLD